MTLRAGDDEFLARGSRRGRFVPGQVAQTFLHRKRPGPAALSGKYVRAPAALPIPHSNDRSPSQVIIYITCGP